MDITESALFFEIADEGCTPQVLPPSVSTDGLHHMNAPVAGDNLHSPDSESQLSIRSCPTSEDIKYKLVRMSIDAVDIYLVERGTALSLWISPVRFSLCNLHGPVMKEGFTLLVPNVQLRHFMMVSPSFTRQFQFSDLSSSDNTVRSSSWNSNRQEAAGVQGGGSGSVPPSPAASTAHSWSYLWLEAGAIAFGPLCLEMGQSILLP